MPLVNSIDQMVKDAETHAEEDKKKREGVEAKNQAESLIHSAEQSLSEHGDKVSEEDRAAIEAAVADLKSAVESGDGEDIKAKSEALAQASMKLGQAMYEAAQAEAAEADAASDAEKGTDENVVDADFEEIDEDDEDKKTSA